MKKDVTLFSLRYALIVLFIGTTSLSFSQTYTDDEEIEQTVDVEVNSSDTDIEENNATVVFDALGIDNSPNPLNGTLQGSKVFLQQIGDLNNANVSVIANSSDISIVQNGNLNNTFLDYQVRTVITDIIQNGDGNVLSDFVNNPLEDISLNIEQQGNYLSFERFGSNELTKSLKFIQTEASPSIIVRSFN